MREALAQILNFFQRFAVEATLVPDAVPSERNVSAA
jgi:hypothetical protein